MTEEKMSSGFFVQAIENQVKKRFLVEGNTGIEKYERLADDSLSDISVMRLQRCMSVTSHFRTVLISVLENKNELEAVLRWAAEVRRELRDPETSDLYLIIAIKDLPDESCARIESGEEFCRKFVLRKNESPNDLISRTFITQLLDKKSDEIITDPLLEAFRKTENQCKSFDKDMQSYWKELLLSGLTSADLVNELFSENSFGGSADD